MEWVLKVKYTLTDNIVLFEIFELMFDKLRRPVVTQWIRPWTSGKNLLTAATEPFGKALYPHCLLA